MDPSQNNEEQQKKIADENANQIQQANKEINTSSQNNQQIDNTTQNQVNQPSVQGDQNNKDQQQVNQSQNAQPQPQPQPQPQENQIVPQVQAQPPPKIEYKIDFTYPMNNYFSEEKIKEIESCPPTGLFQVITKRFGDINVKIQNILAKHERYVLFGLYYRLLNIFIALRQYGRDPKLYFQNKDSAMRFKVSDFDFSEILNIQLNCQLRPDEIALILKSITDKTNTLYSYDEFLSNVNNVQMNENGQMKAIYKDCNFHFNDYLYSFRHYIKDKNIDYKTKYVVAAGSMTALSYDLFQKFLDEIGLKTGHQQEKEYLFCALCDDNYFAEHFDRNTAQFIKQSTLFNLIELNDINEDDFNKSGMISEKIVKINSEWTKNIKNYTEGSKELYRKNYESFKNVFKGIHEKLLRYNMKDLTTYFVESGKDISPEGDIELETFKELMSNIGVSYTVQFDTLLSQFKNNKRKPAEYIKLADFISAYILFVDDDEKPNDVKFDEEKKLEGTEAVPDNNVQYVFRNAHRKFTQEDIDYISDYSNGIYDIITEELHDSVEHFFKQKDKRNEGYIYLDEFKDILKYDLEIDISEDPNSKIFFDFVAEDNMVQGSDIVKIKKIINIILLYSGKEEELNPQNPQNEQNNTNKPNTITNNISISTHENPLIFQEEKPLKGTNNPNPNENERNQNIIDNRIENNQIPKEKEEINTNTNQNPIKTEDNLATKTELINTDINTSSISFDQIMSEFAHFLNNKRIRFNDIFPSIHLDKIINNQTIDAKTLKIGFNKSGFDLTEQEYSVIMTHFDPINKNLVSVEDFKHEIAKYVPKYFSQSYQKINRGDIESKLSKKNLTSSKAVGKTSSNIPLLNGMNKIQSFLNRNKISPENFFYGEFCKKNKSNPDMQVTEELWRNTFIPKDYLKSELIPYLTINEITAIYKAIDIRFTNNITLREIIRYFNRYLKINESPININDETTLNEVIKNELKLLFDNFDTDKNNTITFDNFYKCLKSVNHKATKNMAIDILAEQTKKNPSTVDRDTFNEILYNYIKKSLFIQKEEKDFLMNLFREADIDKNGFLSRSQVKYLMRNKINCNLTDIELDEILNKVDTEQVDEVDIRDFVSLLDNINSAPNNFSNTINTMSNEEDIETIPIMNLNLNLNMHRKIRPKDFISLYDGLPLSFIPSFIREEQQKNNLLPSSCLKPLTKDDILYEDIFPIETLIYGKGVRNNPGAKPYKILNQFIPAINCKIYFDDYATGVSSPDETLFETPNSQFKVVGRLLKVCLFNNKYKVFVGNAVSIDCMYKKEYQDRWYFEDDDSKYNNNIIIRYNGNDIKDIDVVFEFVLVIQKRVEQMLYTVETSCGWCKIPMSFLQISRKEKLKITGGSPIGESDINEADIRKKRIGFIPKLATLFEGQIKSECPIKVKAFNDLSNDEKNNINYLPSLIVCHAAAIKMISIYRLKLGEYILNHKNYLIKSIKDEYDLANMFCKIADVPDAFRVMNEVWKEIVIDGANSTQLSSKEYLYRNFEIFVRKINSVLHCVKFKYNPLDPTELPRGDIKLMQDRDILLNSALRSDQDKKFNKLDYKMEDYSFKPFTMDEINGQKGNSILDKIDEIVTLIN